MKKGCPEYLQTTVKMSLVHCKNIENYNQATCTPDISLQIQNGSSHAVIVNFSLYQLKIDNTSRIVIGKIIMKLNQE